MADEVLGDAEWTQRDVDLLAAWVTSGSDDGVESAAAPVSSSSRDRNSTRQRRRDELAYLQTRSAELERELETLRGRGADADAEPPGEWEKIARRQQRARERAERENATLRVRLARQLKIARSLERLLHKRDHELGDDSSVGRKRQRTVDSSEESESVVFARLLANVEASYAETARVLSGNGLLAASRGHRHVGLKYAEWSDSSGVARSELYVEMTDVTSMPFPLKATANAAWRCITTGYMQLDHRIYDGFSGQDDVLAISYEVTLSRGRLHVDLNARAVMKRFLEADQILDVWESISDTAGSHKSSGEARAILVRERGWTVFRAATNDPSRCAILTCMQMIPLVSYDDSARCSDRQVGVLSNLALDYYGDQLDHAHHAMESLLLDETRELGAIAELLPR